MSIIQIVLSEKDELDKRCYKSIEYSFILITVMTTILTLNNRNLTLYGGITFYFVIQVLLAVFSVVISVMILNDMIFEREKGISYFRSAFCLLDSLLILQIITVFANMFMSVGFENIFFISLSYITLCLTFPIIYSLDWYMYKRKQGKYERTKSERSGFIVPFFLNATLSLLYLLLNFD